MTAHATSNFVSQLVCYTSKSDTSVWLQRPRLALHWILIKLCILNTLRCSSIQHISQCSWGEIARLSHNKSSEGCMSKLLKCEFIKSSSHHLWLFAYYPKSVLMLDHVDTVLIFYVTLPSPPPPEGFLSRAGGHQSATLFDCLTPW